jgi:cytochrome c oxidase cbb3-type subunit 3
MPLTNTFASRLRRAVRGVSNRHLHVAVSGTSVAVALTGVFWWSQQVAPVALAGQQRPRTASSFNSGEARPAEDPAAVARGKTLYGVHCQACHGTDLRGGDMGGPNLLRSQVALTDQHGEKIIPIIQGARQAQGMPNIGLNDEDAGAVAAYIRSVIGLIGSQGTPPGELKPLDVVVGDPERGRAYFASHCASCHSVSGDLKGFASKYPEPRAMQARWILGARSVNADGTRNATVDITTGPGQVVSGTLVNIDDFLVTLRMSDGTGRSYTRDGASPKVVVHDPLQKHREMLPTYTDDDIHNVTAYLVTLK